MEHLGTPGDGLYLGLIELMRGVDGIWEAKLWRVVKWLNLRFLSKSIKLNV